MFTAIAFANACRVCLSSIEGSRSLPVDTIQTSSTPRTYRDFLNQWYSVNDKVIENQLPQRICEACYRRIDDVIKFQTETVSHLRLLVTVAEAKTSGDCSQLRELLHTKKSRQTLYRLKLISQLDIPLDELISVFEQSLIPDAVPVIKQEIAEEECNDGQEIDPLIQASASPPKKVIEPLKASINVEDAPDTPGCESETDIELKFELGEATNVSDTDPSSARSRKRPKDSRIVKKRPCLVDGCEAVIVGQSLQHVREKHRAYCKVCGLVFALYGQATYHAAIHKPKELRYGCEICGKPFVRDYDLKIHMIEFHAKVTPDFECSLCELAFDTKDELKAHREIHLKSPCQFCDRTKPFTSYSMLAAHFRMAHEEQIFKCNQCSSGFLGRREYECHKEKHRNGSMDSAVEFAVKHWNDIYQCVTCERSFYNEQYLTTHLVTVHKSDEVREPRKLLFRRTQEDLDQLEYKFKCNECDARYRLKTSLTGHIRKNHRNERVMCDHCGASFKSKNEVNSHIRYIHTKDFRFQCEFCDKRCNTSSDLSTHRRTHTNERPYKCPYEGCDKDYKTNGARIKHVRSAHTKERPFKCSYESCDKAYVCSQLLKTHVLAHTQEKPFKCWYCELCFNSTNNRRKHCKRHHPGKPMGRELEKQKVDGDDVQAAI